MLKAATWCAKCLFLYFLVAILAIRYSWIFTTPVFQIATRFHWTQRTQFIFVLSYFLQIFAAAGFLFGLIPFGNRLNEYFDQYRSSQSHLNAIVETLRRGKDELLRDNAAIEQEKVNLWALMERLEKYI